MYFEEKQAFSYFLLKTIVVMGSVSFRSIAKGIKTYFLEFGKNPIPSSMTLRKYFSLQ